MKPIRKVAGNKASELENLYEVGRSLDFLLSCPNPTTDIKQDIEDIRACLESTETSSKLSFDGTIVVLDSFMESAKNGDVLASVVLKHFLDEAMKSPILIGTQA